MQVPMPVISQVVSLVTLYSSFTICHQLNTCISKNQNAPKHKHTATAEIDAAIAIFFFFGIFDLLLIAMIPTNILLLSQGSGFFNGLVFWLNIVIGILYLMMRCYIYLQMITFDLSIRKILKNSLIFAFIGFKRLILAFLGNLLLIFIVLGLAYSGAMLALAIVLPLTILLSNCAYMTTYAAYFKIKEIMIDPYNEAA